jgi:hypothetical protein
LALALYFIIRANTAAINLLISASVFGSPNFEDISRDCVRSMQQALDETRVNEHGASFAKTAPGNH